MRCVVVGAGGFIGSAITRELSASGHEVAHARRAQSSTARLSDLDLHSITITDPLDVDTTARSLVEFGAEVVIDLAWKGVANHARNDPSQFANIALTETWALAAAAAGVRHFIGVGSQAEYGPTEGVVDELRPLLPTTRYGVAKAAAGLAARAALLESPTEFSWIRIFSAYGPGDEPHWMVQAIGRRLLADEPAEMTPGTQLWDYVFIDDLARAFDALVQLPRGVGFANVGSGQVHTIRHIVEEMKRISGSASILTFGAVDFRPDQVMHLQADISKLSEATGWAPTVTIEAGLERTIEHLRRNS